MNANAKKWVAALRSGKFEQGAGRLRVGDSYCCLGVACELAVRAGVAGARVSMVERERRIWAFGPAEQEPDSADRNISYLPRCVVEWLGLEDSDGSYYMAPGRPGLATLVGMNDAGASFAEIADFIESEPEGLFRQPEAK